LPPQILVIYATRYGSTAEIAHAVGEILSEEGAEVEVRSLASAGSVEHYDAVVIGSPIRLGRLLPETLSFVRSHEAELAPVPVAYFVTGLTMREDTDENRRQAESYLTPLRRFKEPLSCGVFGGKVDSSRLGALLRFLLTHDRKATLAEGDYRNWPAIRRWARELAQVLGVEAK